MVETPLRRHRPNGPDRETIPVLEQEEPIHAELLGADRLAAHAEQIAANPSASPRTRPAPSLLLRVRDNHRALLASYRAITALAGEDAVVTPAAEWFVDNFHIVEDQVREILDDLPPSYYKGLDKLATGPLAGYPRVLEIAWAYVAHNESRFEPNTFTSFVNAYQRIHPLSIGEVCALAISLRIVLLENLRRLADQFVRRREARARADRIAEACLSEGSRTAMSADDLGEMAPARLETAFCVQLLMRLRDQDPTCHPVLQWLESRLAEQGTTSEALVQREHQRQGTANVMVRNVITGMRRISLFDWAGFLEDVSVTEHVLRRSPGYAAMDFASRDHYRRAVEQLARGSRLDEATVATLALRRCEGLRADTAQTPHLSDLGYWLYGAGRADFARQIGYRERWGKRIGQRIPWLTSALYLTALCVVTATLLVAPIAASSAAGLGAPWLVALALLAVFPATDLAVALVHRTVTAWRKPAFLPRLELRDGVPAELRTMVVVPTLFSDAAQVAAQVDALEVLYLANSSGALHFALLSDWRDASAASAVGDQALVDVATAKVAALNERYGALADGQVRFLLLHRHRQFNASEGTWMGWERKRGKLHELGRLLRGAADTTFATPHPAAIPQGVRYVVTLDADTRLPPGAVARLVGAIAHPLNRARYDAPQRRVVEGYGILQPKVTPTLPTGRTTSLYRWITARQSGMDPYAFAVSDVYQDLFGEGSYVGKGIYDVDAFTAALADRVPDNSLLSHDLFEGLLARTGLDTQTEFFEDTPAHVLVAAARQHRWARGDWQLLPWILKPRRGPLRAPQTAVTAWVGPWKMIDNLRRTLSAPAMVALLISALLLPNSAPSSWLSLIGAALLAPDLLGILANVLPHHRGVSWRAHAVALRDDVAVVVCQGALTIALLAHHVVLMSDAIAKTLVRLTFTKRRLLQWVSAAQTSALARYDARAFYSTMRGSVALATAFGIAAVLIGAPAHTGFALALSGLWVLAPWLACIASQPRLPAPLHALSTTQKTDLRLVARQSWQYFASFVDAASNHLPPDNYQESPAPALARRTSPTNIGLYLLAVVTAHDFGWLGLQDTLARLERTMATLRRLQRYRGHLLNWYDTADLRALEPHYVSTVDSGNLAGHLLTLARACHDLPGEYSPSRAIAGITDGLDVLDLACAHLPDDGASAIATQSQLIDASVRTRALVQAPAHADRLAHLGAVRHEARELADIADAIHGERDDRSSREIRRAAHAILGCIDSHLNDLEAQSDVRARAAAITAHCEAEVAGFDFTFLYDSTRKLLAIGAHAPDGTLDEHFYDLLASEARLASFLAIAKADVPSRHWFHLGRTLTSTRHGSALISWSGSMFEYLMPGLVMDTPEGSLLATTQSAVVGAQIDYGRARGVPWGISESAYERRDLQRTYQYSSFGVPGLGLKRGLYEDLVVAPYATALAAMLDPLAAITNFERLSREGALGEFGFYDALDYNAERLPSGARVGVVQTYMAHHHGMTIVALANVLLGGLFRTRFHDHPLVRATELLLQERAPRGVVFARSRADELGATPVVRGGANPVVRRYASPHATPPRTHVLSNGTYTVMITASGSGFSRWRDLAITRWREDPTRDSDGNYVILRDIESGTIWSAGWHPVGTEPDDYAVAFAEDRVEITRRDGTITTTLEVVVSPQHDAEIRRVSVHNLGEQALHLEVTSYAEVAIATPASDRAHPAFAKLFVSTEVVPQWGALFATRRARAPSEADAWAGQVLAIHGEVTSELEYETDRARFLGRGRELHNAVAIRDGRPLSGTTGAVLDPIFSLRRRITVAPGATARFTVSTFAASSREELIVLAESARDPAAFDRATTMAWTQGQVQLHHLGIEPDEAHLFQRLANRLLYLDSSLRGAHAVLLRNAHGARALWEHGISGDLPIVLLRIEDAADLGLVRQTLRAHHYWRIKRLAVDLVILNERTGSYEQDLQHAIESLLRAGPAARQHDGREPGRLFALRSDLLSAIQRDTLMTLARIVLLGRDGSIAEQVRRPRHTDAVPPRRTRTAALRRAAAQPPQHHREFFNGLGGFTNNGHEYAITLRSGQWTPAPWLNVVANPTFGFQVSESGSGYTWSVNSRENKITPWSNDPVSDPPGEVLYLRDEETLALWTPTALPIRVRDVTYEASHGQGYSRFTCEAQGIATSLVQFVLPDAPLKVSRLTLENRTSRARVISVTAYVEWLLGVQRSESAPTLITEHDTASGAMFATNPGNPEFSGQVAVLGMSPAASDWTADRNEFLGRNATLESPAAMSREQRLSGRTGPGLDACGALRTVLVIAPHGRAEVVASLGAAADRNQARVLLRRAHPSGLDGVMRAIEAQWRGLLDTVVVSTPDRGFDILLGRWLGYQTIACRLWARSALYQCGGAYGFRDQLQDVMALAAHRPDMARAHILLCAGRQFQEGDVQHWWHPPSGRGVRTRCSDDLVWLAHVTHHYIEVTGDHAILGQQVGWLRGPPLRDGEADAYFEPQTTETASTLYEHCARALDLSLATGPHHLPLMGSGDWNDGLSRVGIGGKGESTWLAWLLHTTLWEFAKFADAQNDGARAETWRLHVAALKAAVEAEAWDGAWYRRAFDDAGRALGSAGDEACQIDSIAQSWGVISGGAEPARAGRAMQAVDTRLVQRADRLIRLFAPPFDATSRDVGYVRSYPAGVRENGGQYTHAAAWAVIAFAELGDGDRAMELFSLLNPIRQADSRAGVLRYRVEPYVVAADVYAEPPHVGRGGWTWYTGAAGWLHRAGIEWLLGLRIRRGRLLIDPCIPRSWPGYHMHLRHLGCDYAITVANPDAVMRGVRRIDFDGVTLANPRAGVALLDDGRRHTLTVVLGAPVDGVGS